MERDIQFFVDLERQVWEALKQGDAETDARLLSDDFFGVYESGFSNKTEHVAQLANGATIAEYEMQSPRLAMLTPSMAMLSYKAVMRPEAGVCHEWPETCYVTSIWEERGGTWVNTFSQDTRGVEGP